MYIQNPKYILIKHLDDIASQIHVWMDDDLERIYEVLFFTQYSINDYSGMFEDGRDFTIHYDEKYKKVEMEGITANPNSISRIVE